MADAANLGATVGKFVRGCVKGFLGDDAPAPTVIKTDDVDIAVQKYIDHLLNPTPPATTAADSAAGFTDAYVPPNWSETTRDVFQERPIPPEPPWRPGFQESKSPNTAAYTASTSPTAKTYDPNVGVEESQPWQAPTVVE